LIDGASYGPEELKVIEQAFDDPWAAAIEGNFGDEEKTHASDWQRCGARPRTGRQGSKKLERTVDTPAILPQGSGRCNANKKLRNTSRSRPPGGAFSPYIQGHGREC
jgi:hypothetical protein